MIQLANESDKHDRNRTFRWFCDTHAVSDRDALLGVVKPAVNKLIEDNFRRAREGYERRRLEVADAIMGKRYTACSFDSFMFLDVDSYDGDRKEGMAIRRYQQSVVAEAKSYAENILAHVENGTNLILRGPTGVGKDHLASAITKYASRQLPDGDDHHPLHGGRARVGFCTGPSLFAEIRHSMNGGCEQSVIEKFTRPSVLVLSDPALTGSAEHTSFQRDVLFRSVDRRVTEMRPTVVTINAKNDDTMMAVLGEQIAGRLLDGAIVLDCMWPSYRKPAKVVSPAIRRQSVRE